MTLNMCTNHTIQSCSTVSPSQQTITTFLSSSITRLTTMPRVSLPTHGAASLMLLISRQRKHTATGKTGAGLLMTPNSARLLCPMNMCVTRFKTLLTGHP